MAADNETTNTNEGQSSGAQQNVTPEELERAAGNINVTYVSETSSGTPAFSEEINPLTDNYKARRRARTRSRIMVSATPGLNPRGSQFIDKDAALDFRETALSAGGFTLEADEVAALQTAYPTVDFRDDNVSVAMRLAALGVVQPNTLLEAAQQTRVLEAEEIAYFENISLIIQTVDQDVRNDLYYLAQEPTISISEIPADFTPDFSNSMVFQSLIGRTQEHFVAPVLSKGKKAAVDKAKGLLGKKVAKEAAEGLATAGAKKVAKTAAKQTTKRGVQGILAGLGSLAGPIGTLAAGAVGEIAGELLSRAVGLISKYSKDLRDAAGGVLLTGAYIANSLASVFTAALTALATIAATPFAIGTAIILFIPFAIYIMTVSSWVVPPWEGSASSSPSESLFIAVEKVPTPKTIWANDELPFTVTYNVTISARQATLSNIQISDECEVIRESSAPPCPPTDPTIPAPGDDGYPEVISPGSPYTFSYSMTFEGGGFTDSLVRNTVTITADVEGISDTAAASASVIIGDPPTDCPAGIWPIGTGTVTRGPYSISTHARIEAIDIGTNRIIGFPVWTTHSGIVVESELDGQWGRGNTVTIASSCQVAPGVIVPFVSNFQHLDSRSVAVGQSVTLGDVIGLSGNTGNSTGPHLHYEFRIGTSHLGGTPAGEWPNNPPTMDQPYLPVDAHGCGNSCGFPVN